MTEPTPGTRAICRACGERITFVGPYWDHEGEMKPRHPAQPQEEMPTDQPEPTEDCCDVWPRLLARFDWMRYGDWPDLLTMPHFRIGKDAWRVNHCPSCGRDVRGARVLRSRLEGA